MNKGKPLEAKWYTSEAQICDENTLESDQTTGISDRTTGVSQTCLFLMCWHGLDLKINKTD